MRFKLVLVLSLLISSCAGSAEHIVPTQTTDVCDEYRSLQERIPGTHKIEISSSVFCEVVNCVPAETSFSLVVKMLEADGENKRTQIYRIYDFEQGETHEDVLLVEITFGEESIMSPDSVFIIILSTGNETAPFKPISILEYQGKDDSGNFCFVIPDATPLLENDQQL